MPLKLWLPNDHSRPSLVLLVEKPAESLTRMACTFWSRRLILKDQPGIESLRFVSLVGVFGLIVLSCIPVSIKYMKSTFCSHFLRIVRRSWWLLSQPLQSFQTKPRSGLGSSCLSSRAFALCVRGVRLCGVVLGPSFGREWNLLGVCFRLDGAR